MALKIRLSRGGSKKRPFYKVVIADSRSPRDGRFIEKVGHFNPLLPKDNPDRLKLDLEKIKEWIGKGAKPTEKLERFLGEAKVVPMPVQKNNPKKALPNHYKTSTFPKSVWSTVFSLISGAPNQVNSCIS